MRKKKERLEEKYYKFEGLKIMNLIKKILIIMKIIKLISNIKARL